LPPASIPGGPWQWRPNPQNPRGGLFMGPKGPNGRRAMCTHAPAGTVNNNKDPYWKQMDGDGNDQRYDENGNPITPDQAHPGSNPPQQPTSLLIVPDVAPDGTPIYRVVHGPASDTTMGLAPITPGVPGLSTYPISFPAEAPSAFFEFAFP
jgi:hypothetical protein